MRWLLASLLLCGAGPRPEPDIPRIAVSERVRTLPGMTRIPSETAVEPHFAKSRCYEFIARTYRAYDKHMPLDVFFRENMRLMEGFTTTFDADDFENWNRIKEAARLRPPPGVTAAEIDERVDYVYYTRMAYVWGWFFPHLVREGFDDKDLGFKVPFPEYYATESLIDDVKAQAHELRALACKNVPEVKNIEGRTMCGDQGGLPDPVDLLPVLREHTTPPPLRETP